MRTHPLFLTFVALAVYAQNLTGFALALILLGLVGATEDDFQRSRRATHRRTPHALNDFGRIAKVSSTR
jgi:hypothetical protein